MNKHFILFTSSIIIAIVFNQLLMAIVLYLSDLLTRKKKPYKATEPSTLHLIIIIFFSSILFGCDDE